jgi:YHS domain-containing protein
MKTDLLALAAIFCVALAVAETSPAADSAGVDLKCPVSGQPADKSHAADFNGGKVYFCCDNCPKAFAKDSAKHAAKANLQLVQTGQLKQVACPFSGQPTDPETAIDVGGVKVAFCCNNCKGKAEKAKGDEQLGMIFSDTSKGFKAVEK